jgi:hypothetical protein
MVVIDLTRNLYFATAPPWSRKQGVVVKHLPHQTSFRVKDVQKHFAEQAHTLKGTRGRGASGLPRVAEEMVAKLKGYRAPTVPAR